MFGFGGVTGLLKVSMIGAQAGVAKLANSNPADAAKNNLRMLSLPRVQLIQINDTDII